jgi:glycosyltransferase involved in cell wall biosynthesis
MNYFAIGLDLVPANGGPTKSVPNFARALGGKVVSFTYRDKLPADPNPEIKHIRSVGGPLGKAYLVTPPSEIRRLNQMTGRAELLSCHILYRHSAHWVANRAERRGIPYWVVPHGCLDPYVFSYGPPVKRLWMGLFGRRILREASAVIFSTQREKEKASCWLDRDNGHVVPWPVELPDLKQGEEDRLRWRAEQGFAPTDRVLLSLGRLHSMKQPLETVEALAAAGQANLHLVFIGPEGDVSATALLTRAEALGVRRQVRVLKPIYGPAKFTALFGSDAYVSLSLRENFNNAAAEALASGRPVILSPGNDLGPDLSAHRCSYLISENTAPAATGALQIFARAPAEQLEKTGLNARLFAETILSFDRFRSRLLDIHRNHSPL